MGLISPPDTDRNEALYRDYKSGKFTGAELVAKYKISAARVYYIIDKQKKKNAPKS